jgi:hypothetical protein
MLERSPARPPALIEDQPVKLLLCIGSADPRGMLRGAVMRLGLPPARIPTGDGLCCPLGGPIGMALGAGTL